MLPVPTPGSTTTTRGAAANRTTGFGARRAGKTGVGLGNVAGERWLGESGSGSRGRSAEAVVGGGGASATRGWWVMRRCDGDARHRARGRVGRMTTRAVADVDEAELAELADAAVDKAAATAAVSSSVSAVDDVSVAKAVRSDPVDVGGAVVIEEAASAKEANNNVGFALGVAVVVALACAGVVFREDIGVLMQGFMNYVDVLGPLGYALFLVGYVVLEVLAVPAFPLTMSAGALFGNAAGTLLVTTAATIAAGISFLIARYIARDKIAEMAENYPKFKAIDRALGEDSLRVVAIMRLSPLMPFALSNYLYGLTSVKFKPYVIGSFFGMMPGTFAYVSAGSASRQIAEGAIGSDAILSTLFGVSLAILSASYVGKLASKAVAEETASAPASDPQQS